MIGCQATSGNMVLEFSSRHKKPYDTDTIMSIFHRTTGGHVSVCLKREVISDLAKWFFNPYDLQIKDVQTSAIMSEFGDIAIRWNGSGNGKKIYLGKFDRLGIANWLSLVDRDGWEGWKSK